MTIDEAIKIQENLFWDKSANLIQGESEAIQLGIEALKARKRDRVCKGNYVNNLLPGETENKEKEVN